MCGISVVFQNSRAAELETVRRMCDQIIHRGPDSDGYHMSGNVGMGMRRLRIIDIEGGDQPIYNQDRSLAIVFNGEIYNFQELRSQLVAKNYKFVTNSDTEVIVHLYEDMGPRALLELNGMFGFAIHDENKNRLFIARDRLGIKPVYYVETEDAFYAASEIKSLLTIPDIDRAIDEVALDHYFSWQYIPEPRTIFKHIKKLPAGHTLIKEAGRPAVVEKYWQIVPPDFSGCSEEDLIAEFRTLFDAAVARHIIADVPVGVFLSGGIDSGALVASMARIGADVRTLSLGFPEKYQDFDERQRAKLVAKRYGTTHEEIVVDPKIEGTVESLAQIFDEPMGDSGAIPNYLICKEAKKSVTVALSGLGGDELSGGYARYLGMQFADTYRKLPRFLRKGVIGPAIGMIRESRRGIRAIDRAKRFAAYAELPWLDRFHAFSSVLDEDRRRTLYSDRFRQSVDLDSTLTLMREFSTRIEEQDSINRMLAIDQHFYMSDDLLVVADRTSMAASLEVRVPFLDHSLVEFMAGVPGSMKVRRTQKKRFLKLAFEHDLPREILYGKKAGFSLPVARWMREDLRELMEDTLSKDRILRDGWFNADAVAILKREHCDRTRNWSGVLWSMMMFHLWADNYAR